MSDTCCSHMQFAVDHAIIRQINGPYFGPDVLPSPLTSRIVACPWCGRGELAAELTRVLKMDFDRLTSERDEAMKMVVDAADREITLTRERDAARAHFRRACELLEKQPRQAQRLWPKKAAGEWQAEIEKELEGEP